jgi:hypothetical protein
VTKPTPLPHRDLPGLSLVSPPDSSPCWEGDGKERPDPRRPVPAFTGTHVADVLQESNLDGTRRHSLTPRKVSFNPRVVGSIPTGPTYMQVSDPS